MENKKAPPLRGFILGDCMEYLPEIPDQYFDLAIVDPPYGGVSQGGYMRNSHPTKGVYHDYNTALWNQTRPSPEYFSQLFRVSKNAIIWGGNYFADLLPWSQCWLCWDKERPAGVTFADFELAYTTFDRASRIFRFAWNGRTQGDMANKEKKIHPTQKPVALYKWVLSTFAEKGAKILDTHVGSASSLIACEDLGFEYLGFEIDEGYYKDAKKRLDDFNAQISFGTIWNS